MNKKEITKLRNAVKRARATKGHSLRDVDAETGVSYATISRFERGLLHPTLDSLLPLARYAGVKVEL